MAPKLTQAQRRAVAEWTLRTQPDRSYSISEVFPEQNNAHKKAMYRLVALDLVQHGIPGGNPLREGA
ncbi:MAG: hypothetical protein ACYDHX_04000 [Methanothrix sp.]